MTCRPNAEILDRARRNRIINGRINAHSLEYAAWSMLCFRSDVVTNVCSQAPCIC